MTGTFNELNNRYVLKCELLGEEGLHIGTGLTSTETDAPFILQSGTAFLPGSSLRGAMRATVERIVRSLFPNPLICTLFEECDPTVCMAGNTETRQKFEADVKELSKELEKPEGLKLCVACLLFGSTLMASRLKVTDAIQTATPRLPVRRDGVGIDRDTETAKAQIKYDFEVLERGCTFQFEIHLENASTSDFALIYILIQELKQGISIGGKKNRGLGRVQLKPDYAVQYFDKQRDYGLLAYLKSGMKSETAKNFEKKLDAEFDAFVASPKGA